MKKKIGLIFVITMLSLTTMSIYGGESAKADSVVLFGKISYYVPTKPGYHGKTMTESDCAVDDGYKYLPKGTKITVKNQSNGKSKVLQKWDIGNFPSGVIIDVLPNTFTYLGGVKSQGYIYNGRAEWLDPYSTTVVDQQ